MINDNLNGNLAAVIVVLETSLSAKTRFYIQIKPALKSTTSKLFSFMRNKYKKSKTIWSFYLKCSEWLSARLSFVISASHLEMLQKIGPYSLVVSSSSDRSKQRKTEDIQRNYEWKYYLLHRWASESSGQF